MIVPRDIEGQRLLWRWLSSIFGNSSCPEPGPVPTPWPSPTPWPTPTPWPSPTPWPTPSPGPGPDPPQPEPCPKTFVRALWWQNVDAQEVDRLVDEKFPVFRPEFPDFPEAPLGYKWYKLESFDVSFVLNITVDEPTDWRLPLGYYISTSRGSFSGWKVEDWQGTAVNFCLRVWVSNNGQLHIAWFRQGRVWDELFVMRRFVVSVLLCLPIFNDPVWLVYPTVCWDMVYFEGNPDVVYDTVLG